MDSSCPPRTQLFPEGRLLLATSSLSPESRLVTSPVPASTGQVALGAGASHSWIAMTRERGDSRALVSTGFQGKEGVCRASSGSLDNRQMREEPGLLAVPTQWLWFTGQVEVWGGEYQTEASVLNLRK